MEIELPDGTIAEFPDGTPPDVIKGALRKRFPAPDAQPQSPQMQSGSNAFAQNAMAMIPTKDSMAGALQTIDDTVRGAANGLTFGMADRFAGYMGGEGTQAERAKSEQAQERSPIAYTGGEIGGAVAGLGKLQAMGLTAGRLLPQGAGLLGKTGASVVDGLAINELMNAGYGRDFGENAGLAAIAGGVAPAIGQGLSKVADVGKAALGFGNETRAKKAILELLTRSGKSVDDIASEMSQATADGQGVYTLADALGNSGQRMLSGIARSPGDMRQRIAEQLLQRQSGQADRLTNALVEGFDTPKTASQMTKALTESRRAAGYANYGAAKEAAGAVDTSAAIKAIDEVVSPGLTPMIGAGATDNGVYATLKRARSFLTNGKATVSDYERAFLAKQEMDAMIEAGGTTANLLRPARNALDDALAKSSAPYAAARDAYRQGSKAIEAVDTGAMSSSGRIRSQDSIPQFQGLSQQEQAAFRSGYVDPLIASIQSTKGSMSDKSRLLLSDKTAKEFPAFAVGNRGQQLQKRIAREATMSKTMADALGGSKTADNLADSADVSQMALAALQATRQPIQAGISLIGQLSKGRNEKTRNMIAEALLSTGKDAPQQIIKAIETGKKLTAKQDAIAKMLLGGSLVSMPAN
jgi:hypothetical protein